MANYAVAVEQTIPFIYDPVEQELIIIASCALCVAAELNVKFVTEVTINNDNIIGNFKTTPNNAGVGVIDISHIIKNYVSADNIAGTRSTFKANGANDKPFSMHLIDQYSTNTNTCKRVSTKTKVEFTDASGTTQETSFRLSSWFYALNGYVKNKDSLSWVNDIRHIYGDGFGYDTTNFLLKSGTLRKFLSNSPQTQWARLEDYGTMALIPRHLEYDAEGVSTTIDDLKYIHVIQYPEYDGQGTALANTYIIKSAANGAFDTGGNNLSDNKNDLLYFGVFPANLLWSDSFNTQKNIMKSYTVSAVDNSLEIMSETKTVNILCPNLKGYNPIRLAWLNQWGTWDYFTFNQKSIKSISTKGSTYKQLGGTWNAKSYNPYGYKGGNKTFRVNATEKISMNTDYLTEEHSGWFEELINSPEIYILKDWELPRKVLTPSVNGEPTALLTQYSTPCTLKTTSFTKKTIANDKLVQYTIEVEKSKTLRTQAI